MRESTQQSLDTLSIGINAELAAYIFYKRASEKIEDQAIVAMLTNLAAEEKNHYWMLESEYDSLVRSEKWISYNDIMRKDGLPEIPDEMSEKHKKRLDALETTSDIRSILEMALTLEEEARDFYRSQIDKIDDPLAVEIFTFLSKFEQGHINLISGWLAKLG